MKFINKNLLLICNLVFISIACSSSISNNEKKPETTPTPSVETKSNIKDVKLPPLEFKANISADTVFVGDTLSCSGETTGEKGTAIVYSYFWEVSHSPNGPFSKIKNETNKDLKITKDFAHKWLICVMQATDSNKKFTYSLPSDVAGVSNSSPKSFNPSLSATSIKTKNTVICSGETEDVDGDLISYGFQWYLAQEEKGIYKQLHGANTESLFIDGSYSNKFIKCEITAIDELGRMTRGMSDSLRVENTPPSAFASIVTSPNYIGQVTEALVGDILKCSGLTSDIDGDALTYRYEWKVIYADLTESALNLSTNMITVGQDISHQMIRCDIYAIDSHGDETVSVSSNINILNSNPLAFSSHVKDLNVKVGSNITCDAVASDPNNDPLSYTYEWYYEQNGSEIHIAGETYHNFTIPPALSRKNVKCRAIATDPYGGLTVSATSNSVYVNNTKPEKFTAAASTTTPFMHDSVSCAGETIDIDENVLTYSFKWISANSDNGPWTTLTNETNSSIYIEDALAHKVLRCEITARDGFAGERISERTPYIYIQNTPPANFESFVSSTTAKVNDTLSCSGTTSDLDSDTLSYSFRWLISKGGDPFTYLDEETTNTILITSNHAHSKIKCEVTANDSFGGITVASHSEEIYILNTAPNTFFSELPVENSRVGDSILCIGMTTDNDSDEITYEYKWLISESENGTYTVAENDILSTLLITPNHSRKYIKCEITALDAPHDGVTVSEVSNAHYVENTPPADFSSNVDKESLYVGDTITCFGETTDADEDALTYSYQWIKATSLDGAYLEINGETNSTLEITSEEAHHFVICRMGADDFYGDTTISSLSNPAEVLNTAPENFVASPSQSTARVGDKVSCLGSTVDIDEDALVYTYEWKILDNLGEEGETSPTEVLSDFYVSMVVAHKYIMCRMSAHDGYGGVTVSPWGDAVTIENTPPADFTAFTDVGEVYVNDIITCGGTTADIDGDNPYIISYNWFSKDPGGEFETIDGVHTSTLTASNTYAHKHLSCEVLMADGYGGETLSSKSQSVIYLNTAPLAFQSAVDRTTAKVGDNIICSGESVDLDDDAISYTHNWYFSTSSAGPFETALVPGGGDTFTVTSNEAHGYMVCERIAEDGHLGVTVGEQNITAVFIENSSPSFTSGIEDRSVNENDVLTVNVSGSDPDGDGLTYFCISCGGGTMTPEGIFTFAPGYEIASRQTPSVPFNLVFRVEDHLGGFEEKSLVYTVNNTDRLPTDFTLTCPSEVFENEARIYINYDVSDPDGDMISVSYEGGFPAGHNVLSEPGLKRVSIAGSYDLVPHTWPKPAEGWELIREIKLKASYADGPGYDEEKTCSVKIKDVNRSPTYSTTCSNQNETNSFQRVYHSASDPDDDPLTFEYVSGWPGSVTVNTTEMRTTASLGYNFVPHTSTYKSGSTWRRQVNIKGRILENQSGQIVEDTCTYYVMDVDRPPTANSVVRNVLSSWFVSIPAESTIDNYLCKNFVPPARSASDPDGDNISYITATPAQCVVLNNQNAFQYPDGFFYNMYYVPVAIYQDYLASANGKTSSIERGTKTKCYVKVQINKGSYPSTFDVCAYGYGWYPNTYKSTNNWDW